MSLNGEHLRELECLREFCRQYQMEISQLKAENEQLQTDKENAQYCFRKLKEINDELENKLFQQAKTTRGCESTKYINSNKKVKWADIFDCLQENEKLSIGSAMAIANRFNEKIL